MTRKPKLNSWWVLGIGLLLSVSLCWGQATVNARFHTYAEMLAEIDSLLAIHSDIMRVDTIGYSQEDTIPIVAVKISDSVELEEDEPSVLYVGQVHAEEILGNEIVMQLMNDILSGRNTPPELYWIRDAEIWIVPSDNPEGLQVVMDGWDDAFRKNKRDNIGDGIFRYIPGRGGDTSGVDPNRNFALNWDRGDTLLQPGSHEIYDYYRGPGPFSESETQALRDFSYQIQPVFSIIYHSSRTGNVSEHVVYAWEWEGRKHPPDFTTINYEGCHVAGMIPKYFEPNNYIPTAGGSRKGVAQDWYYQALGTIQFLIEVGTSNIHPDTASIIEEIVDDNLPAAKYLINRTIGYPGEPQLGMFKGHVTDASTQQPLVAEVRILEAHSRLLHPRMTDPVYGGYYRPMYQGTYTLMFRKEGYQTHVVTRVCNPTSQTTVNVALQPVPMHAISGTIVDLDSGTPLPGIVYIIGEFSDTLDVASGGFSIQKPEGDYSLLVAADLGHMPYYGQLTLNSNRNFCFGLTDDVAVELSDGFESGLGDWTSGGTHNNWGVVSPGLAGGSAVSGSPGGEYHAVEDSWLQVSSAMDFSGYQTAALTFWHTYDFEVDYDSGFVEVSTDQGNSWEVISPGYTEMDRDWWQEWISLDEYAGESSVLLRFHVQADSFVAESGWTIDEVTVIGSDGMSTDVGHRKMPLPYRYALHSPYPNPFNSSVVIPYEIARGGDVSISATNIVGRKVFELRRSHSEAGRYKYVWNGRGDGEIPLSSGIYFITFRAGGFQRTQKALMLK